jgi:hypothetical protein
VYVILFGTGLATAAGGRVVYHDDFVSRCPCGEGWAATGCLDSISSPETTTLMLEGRLVSVSGRRPPGGPTAECGMGEGDSCMVCVGVDPAIETVSWSHHLWDPVSVDACRGLMDPLLLAPSFIGGLCGTVVDDAGRPLGGSSICVRVDGDSVQDACVATTYSTIGGNWAISVLLNGTYTVTTSLSSYISHTVSVDVGAAGPVPPCTTTMLVSTLLQQRPQLRVPSWVNTEHDYDFADGTALDRLLNDFTFLTEDLNWGNAAYQDRGSAINQGLVEVVNQQLRLSIGTLQDSGCTQPGLNQCVPSVKLQSNFEMNPNRLTVFRAAVIPHNELSWPAFWSTTVLEWVKTGSEMDQFESVGDGQGVHSTLHTPAGCITPNTAVVGNSKAGSINCNEENGYVGCGVTHTNPDSSRSGTFAQEWYINPEAGTGHIRYYWWAYADQSVFNTTGPLGTAADPSDWGAQIYGDFTLAPTACPISYFSQQKLIFNTQFGGEWPAAIYENGQTAINTAIAAGAVKSTSNDTRWDIDHIRVMSLGQDLVVGALTPPPACTVSGEDAFVTNVCLDCCVSGDLLYTVQGQDGVWSVRCYPEQARCVTTATQGCIVYNNCTHPHRQ